MIKQIYEGIIDAIPKSNKDKNKNRDAGLGVQQLGFPLPHVE